MPRTFRSLAVLALLPAVFAPPAFGGDTFTGGAEFGSGATIPIAWADYDGDGNLDLAVGNYFNQANELYVGAGDGSFVRRAHFGTASTFAFAWADYNNDGRPDLAVGNYGLNALYVNDGAGGFPMLTPFESARTIAVAWADYDLDGDLDLAVGNGILGVVQQNRLYVQNSDGSFTGQDQFGTGQTDSLAWADFDLDGDLDLAVGNGGFSGPGQNYLYVNNGDGTFAERVEFGLGDTAVVAWADANNDGRLDLAVGNWNAGQSYLYVNNSDGSFTAVPNFGANDTNTVAWGDFDLDGDLDLAVGNGDFQSAGQNHLYINDGSGSFTERAEFGLGSTDGVAWGDCDNDGDLDLAVGNEHSPPQNELWINETDADGYLRLKLVGRYHALGDGYSNRDGIGAAVAVYAAGHAGDPAYLRGYQQVEAKGGFSSQNAMEVTFGLPLDERVDVTVDWPGSAGRSIVQQFRSVGVGDTLTVLEMTTGDLNCDGEIGAFDIEPFLAALFEPDEYAVQYPNCEIAAGDINADGAIDAFDIEPFLELLLP